jgi:hypothetical protein
MDVQLPQLPVHLPEHPPVQLAEQLLAQTIEQLPV